MLKIPKPVFFIAGMALGAVGVWYFFGRGQQAPPPKEKKEIVRIEPHPRNDTALLKLNSILKRNEGESHYYSGNDVRIESYENIDRNSPLYDSLKKVMAAENSTINSNQENMSMVVYTDNEVIKRDKLIGRETVKIKQVEGSSSSTDSLSSAMTGINPKSTTSIEVEHWASPINYKGYKLGRTRLVLFSTKPGETKLLWYNNELYLIFSQKVYHLKASPGFSSLKPLPDKKLSASLLEHVR